MSSNQVNEVVIEPIHNDDISTKKFTLCCSVVNGYVTIGQSLMTKDKFFIGYITSLKKNGTNVEIANIGDVIVLTTNKKEPGEFSNHFDFSNQNVYI